MEEDGDEEDGNEEDDDDEEEGGDTKEEQEEQEKQQEEQEEQEEDVDNHRTAIATSFFDPKNRACYITNSLNKKGHVGLRAPPGNEHVMNKVGGKGVMFGFDQAWTACSSAASTMEP